jgi:molybdate transport system substrate-binding protein
LQVHAETLVVACAANLKPAMTQLARAFEAQTPGVKIEPTYGASGVFFAQLQNGAPFDLFFSADREYPRKLVEAKLAPAEVVYAFGKLVLWTPATGPALEGVSSLADAKVRRIAIANPKLAPYGRAAEEALRAAGIHDQVRKRLVLGENVSQTAQFAQSGAADAALLPMSLALTPELTKAGRSIPIASSMHEPIEQSAVVVSSSKQQTLASAFLAFVTESEGRAILERHGYASPGR